MTDQSTPRDTTTSGRFDGNGNYIPPRDTTTTREPRKALLSDELVSCGSHINSPRAMTAWNVRAFYENLITSGELRVVKTAKNVGHEFECSACGFALFDATQNPPVPDEFSFCPKCGARIIP